MPVYSDFTRSRRQSAATRREYRKKKYLYAFIYTFIEKTLVETVSIMRCEYYYIQTLDVNTCMHYICILNVPYTRVVYAIHVHTSTLYIYVCAI